MLKTWRVGHVLDSFVEVRERRWIARPIQNTMTRQGSGSVAFPLPYTSIA
jgi:hypothetical protein